MPQVTTQDTVTVHVSAKSHEPWEPGRFSYRLTSWSKLRNNNINSEKKPIKKMKTKPNK